jgi:hypothetical protein
LLGGSESATSSSCSARGPAATGAAPSSTPTTTKRPSVQIGDPFKGKKLLECSLEPLDPRSLLVGRGPGAFVVSALRAALAAFG